MTDFKKKLTCVVLGANGFIGAEVCNIARKMFTDVLEVDLVDSDLNIDVVNETESLVKNILQAGDNLYIINLVALNPKAEILKQNSIADIERYKLYIKVNLDYPVLLATKLVECAINNPNKKIDLCLLGSMYATFSANKNLYPGTQSKDLGYLVSKHGLSGLIRGMNSQYLPDNFRINMVNPGAVENEDMPDYFKENFVKITGGKLNSVSEVASFLCSLGMSYQSLYNGSIIDITGGVYV